MWVRVCKGRAGVCKGRVGRVQGACLPCARGVWAHGCASLRVRQRCRWARTCVGLRMCVHLRVQTRVRGCVCMCRCVCEGTCVYRRRCESMCVHASTYVYKSVLACARDVQVQWCVRTTSGCESMTVQKCRRRHVGVHTRGFERAYAGMRVHVRVSAGVHAHRSEHTCAGVCRREGVKGCLHVERRVRAHVCLQASVWKHVRVRTGRRVCR